MADRSTKTVLVTGAAGQLGRSLEKVSGECSGWDLLFPDEKQADITDPQRIEAFIEEYGIGAVINCAAYTAVDRAEEEPEAAYEINATGPANLAQLCKQFDIPLIHISTDYVFDGAAEGPYSEDSPVNPLGVYGRTKLAGEEAVRHSGGDAVVVRTSWLYSEFGNNFVATMLRLGSQGAPLRVVCDQSGTPAYATDLARAILRLLGRGFAGYHIVHYNALGNTTWYGFAEEIFRQAGIDADLSPVTTDQYPVKAPRPKNSVMYVDKAVLWGLALRPWQEALSDCLGEIKKADSKHD